LINFGPSQGKIAVLLDIVDKNRCIIDGPSGRQVVNLKRITLSKFCFSIHRRSITKKILDFFITNKIQNKWAKSQIGKRILRAQQKKKFSDFENFKFMIGKKHKSNFSR